MARNPSSTSKSRSASSKPKARAASPAEKRARKAGAPTEAPERRLFDDRVRRDIAGVALAVLGAVLFVAAVLPTDAVVTSFMSSALHLTLGLGAYLLPFLLVALGASFLVRFDRERVPARVAVGLVMIFFAALVLLALFTPGSESGVTERLFAEAELTARGGYVGAGVAWVGLSLFGQVVSCILMVGVVLAGLAVIGFSLSGLIERVQDARAARAERDEDDDVLAAPPFARMRRPSAARVPVVPTMGEDFEQAETTALPKPAERRRGRASRPKRVP